MSVFISHSFENKPEFDNIADALEQAEIPYWNPSSIEVGESLRDQLRNAISACDICVFVATHSSVTSSWCGAELGAFWGAGKKVIVYIADSSLKEEQVPRQFQGDVWERRISKIIKNIKEYRNRKNKEESEQQVNDKKEIVGEMPTHRLLEILNNAVDRAHNKALSLSVMSNISQIVSKGLSSESSDHLKLLLESLIGMPSTDINAVASNSWPYNFAIIMTSGRWKGFALSQKSENRGWDEFDTYNLCLLIRFEDEKVRSAAIIGQVQEIVLARSGKTILKVSDPFAYSGRGEFGQPK